MSTEVLILIYSRRRLWFNMQIYDEIIEKIIQIVLN